jgi:hypothetical protein
MEQPLPRWQAGADILSNGTANSDAVAAAMSELLMDVLNDRPAPPVLFLPYDVSNRHRSLPVKLTHVGIASKTLTLEVQPLTPSQRHELLASLRAPWPDHAALGDVTSAKLIAEK